MEPQTGRFDYVKYDNPSMDKQEAAKIAVQSLERLINELGAGRAQSLALTKLEEVYMWIGKAIRDEQVRDRSAALQEERTNS